MDSYDDDDEDNQEQNYTEGKDGLIFLIDANRSMFTCSPGEEEAAFRTTIKCCKSLLLNKIISSSKDLVGIIFFGTEKTDNELNAQHITSFQVLAEPCVASIKKLGKMIESPDFDDFDNTYGHSNDFNISDTFWLSQIMFSTSGKLAQYRVFLFTNQSEPHPASPDYNHQARVRATDFHQLNIDLDLIYMGTRFDPSIFYKELVQLALGDTSADFQLPPPPSKIEELLERVCRQDNKKRALSHLIFKMGDDLEISVNLYNLVRESKLPQSVPLDSKTNQQVVRPETCYFHGDTDEVALPCDIDKSLTIGDKEILITPIEHKQLYSITEPGLILNCFTDLSNIQPYHHLKPSAFIYPDEAVIKGSTTLFAGLLKRCQSRSKAMMCWLTIRYHSSPQWVALVPQMEEVVEGVQKIPPGFHIVYIPFRDQVAVLEPPVPLSVDTPLLFHCKSYTGNKFFTSHKDYEAERVAETHKLEKERRPLLVSENDPEVGVMKQMIKKLQIRYDPNQFKNPHLQCHWNFIEALALDYDEPRSYDDNTKPDDRMIRTQLGDLPQQLMEIISDSTQMTQEEASNQIVANLAKEGKLSSCTVAQMKEYLYSAGIDIPFRPVKAALIDMVNKHLGICK